MEATHPREKPAVVIVGLAALVGVAQTAMTDWSVYSNYAPAGAAIGVVSLVTLAAVGAWAAGLASARIPVASICILAVLQCAHVVLLLGPEQGMALVQIGEISGIYLISMVLAAVLTVLAVALTVPTLRGRAHE